MPAAGSGQRFGAPIPKQYLPLGSSTVIEHALAPFLADSRCLQIVVALDPADAHFTTLAPSRDARLRRVAGGARRCDSVRNALQAITASPDSWVLVHDAARPCLSRRDLDALLQQASTDHTGGLLAVPLADTLKRGDETRHAIDTPARAGLWRALTPQMFRVDTLKRALAAAEAAGNEPTDEAQAIEWLGLRPLLVAGSPGNLKVTTSGDLSLAAAILARENAV
jgi:2-C-methyl-D-erythritol 4-phosphate cytidylyltransferase